VQAARRSESAAKSNPALGGRVQVVQEEKHEYPVQNAEKNMNIKIPCTETCIQGPCKENDAFRPRWEIDSFYEMHNESNSNS
jgi:hypothetical protein